MLLERIFGPVFSDEDNLRPRTLMLSEDRRGRQLQILLGGGLERLMDDFLEGSLESILLLEIPLLLEATLLLQQLSKLSFR